MDALSDRELQVFRLIGQGRTARQIAETLARSVKTVESHLEHIKNKLGILSAGCTFGVSNPPNRKVRRKLTRRITTLLQITSRRFCKTSSK